MNIIKFTGTNVIGISILSLSLIGSACSGAGASGGNQNTPPSNAAANRTVVQSTPVQAPTPVPSPSDDSDEAFLKRMRESNVRTSGSRINKANFEKISTGMKLSEVEKILGDKGTRTGMNNKNGVISEFYKWNVLGENVWIEVTVKDGAVIAKTSENLR